MPDRRKTNFNGPESSLILLFARFFAVPLACQSFLYPALLAGLQIEGVPLDFFNDVVLLDFPFEPA